MKRYNTKIKPVAPQLPAVIEPREITIDDLPSEEFMLALDIKQTQFGDFLKAFRFILYQSQGMSLAKAGRAAGISRSCLYEEYWRGHIATAQRAFLGAGMAGVMGARNQVFEEWPDLINSLVARVKSPLSELRDVTAAMEFLYEAVISQQPETRQDDSAERQYLQQGNNFSPMAAVNAIRAEPGSTIIINNNSGTKPDEPLILEAEIVEDSD